jgi:hypothetical protein
LITAFCLMAGGMIFMASVSFIFPSHFLGGLRTDGFRLATASRQWKLMAWTLCSSSRSRWA